MGKEKFPGGILKKSEEEAETHGGLDGQSRMTFGASQNKCKLCIQYNVTYCVI